VWQGWWWWWRGAAREGRGQRVPPEQNQHQNQPAHRRLACTREENGPGLPRCSWRASRTGGGAFATNEQNPQRRSLPARQCRRHRPQ
jgi:hypothetical protein